MTARQYPAMLQINSTMDMTSHKCPFARRQTLWNCFKTRFIIIFFQTSKETSKLSARLPFTIFYKRWKLAGWCFAAWLLFDIQSYWVFFLKKEAGCKEGALMLFFTPYITSEHWSVFSILKRSKHLLIKAVYLS